MPSSALVPDPDQVIDKKSFSVTKGKIGRSLRRGSFKRDRPLVRAGAVATVRKGQYKIKDRKY